MPDRLDLRYRTSAENDNDRAGAIFAGAVLVYRSLPAMHDLVDCLREITQQEVGLSDPCLAESILESEEFRHRASSARQIVREHDDVARLYKKVLLEAGVDVSAVFYDHFKLRFQPSDDASKTRYMRDLPVASRYMGIQYSCANQLVGTCLACGSRPNDWDFSSAVERAGAKRQC